MSSNTCARCGTPLNPDQSCPACLLELAFPVDDQSSSQTTSSLSPEPEIESVRKAFPQLEIIKRIGRGGMGTVFKARQPKLDRFVALKILSSELATRKHMGRATFADRFAREGKLLARLSHPNIVAVYDFGRAETTDSENGPVTFFYLMLEYVDGVNLRQAMREERFTPEQAFAIVPKICDALQYAHDEGVMHRDIKPENILLDTRGRVKIADFGIASVARWTAKGATAPLQKPAPDGRWSPSEEKLTGEGQILGTPSYMAPEQRDDPNRVDHRADIYSLGVVFYELLTGELPRDRFPRPSEKTPVGAEIDHIVLKALHKERDKRQQSAEELKTEIETATEKNDSHTVSPQPISPQPAVVQADRQDSSRIRATPDYRRRSLALIFVQCWVFVFFTAFLYDFFVDIVPRKTFYDQPELQAMTRFYGTVIASVLTTAALVLNVRWALRQLRAKPVSPARLAYRGLGLVVAGLVIFLSTLFLHSTFANKIAYIAFDAEWKKQMAVMDERQRMFHEKFRQNAALTLQIDQREISEEEGRKLRAALDEQMERCEKALQDAEKSFQSETRRKSEYYKRVALNVALVGYASAAIFAFAGAVCGWVHLVRIRRLPEKPGLVEASIAALGVTALVLLGTIIFLVVFPFMFGHWGTQREFVHMLTFMIGLLLGIAANIYFLRRTYRWLNAVFHAVNDPHGDRDKRRQPPEPTEPAEQPTEPTVHPTAQPSISETSVKTLPIRRFQGSELILLLFIFGLLACVQSVLRAIEAPVPPEFQTTLRTVAEFVDPVSFVLIFVMIAAFITSCDAWPLVQQGLFPGKRGWESGEAKRIGVFFWTLGKATGLSGVAASILGFVLMLSNLDPSRFLSGVWISMLTTIYAVLIAVILFVPTAVRGLMQGGSDGSSDDGSEIRPNVRPLALRTPGNRRIRFLLGFALMVLAMMVSCVLAAGDIRQLVDTPSIAFLGALFAAYLLWTKRGRLFFNGLALRGDGSGATANLFERLARLSLFGGLLAMILGHVMIFLIHFDPHTIGYFLAFAVLGSFYGILLSVFVFTPISVQLQDQ